MKSFQIKIAIYSPNWIGDAVMALPFIQKIKDNHPKAEIYIICKEWVTDIYKNHEGITGVIPLSNSDLKGFHNIISIGKMLKSKNFDLSYTLTESFRSAFILWQSNIRIRIGFNAQWRRYFLTKPVTLPIKLIHRSEKYLKLIDEKFNNRAMPNFFLSENEKIWAKKKMEQIGFKKPTAIFPFSVGVGRTLSARNIKKWIKGSSKNYLIFGSIKDSNKAKALINRCNNNSIKEICGKYTLRESISLIALCESSIATDSGLGHISAALGIPTVSFFGKGNSLETSPLGGKTKVIKHCNPCLGNKCMLKKEDVACIKKISKKDLEVAVNQLIDQ